MPGCSSFIREGSTIITDVSDLPSVTHLPEFLSRNSQENMKSNTAPFFEPTYDLPPTESGVPGTLGPDVAGPVSLSVNRNPFVSSANFSTTNFGIPLSASRFTQPNEVGVPGQSSHNSLTGSIAHSGDLAGFSNFFSSSQIPPNLPNQNQTGLPGREEIGPQEFSKTLPENLLTFPVPDTHQLTNLNHSVSLQRGTSVFPGINVTRSIAQSVACLPDQFRRQSYLNSQSNYFDQGAQQHPRTVLEQHHTNNKRSQNRLESDSDERKNSN